MLLISRVRKLITSLVGEDNLNCEETRANMEARLLREEEEYERFGFREVSYEITDEGDMVLTLEVLGELTCLADLEHLVHRYWFEVGIRDFCFVEWEIEQEQAVFHFMSGFHGGGCQVGRVRLVGERVGSVLQKYHSWRP